jgi:hypothetical protein
VFGLDFGEVVCKLGCGVGWCANWLWTGVVCGEGTVLGCVWIGLKSEAV